MESGIYKITNLVNDKVYIGSALNLKRRFHEHISSLTSGTHFNRHLRRAWLKYGSENFKFEILEECDSTFLLEREQYYIDTYNSVELGYNILPTAYSSLGRRLSEVIKKKISETRKRLIKEGKVTNYFKKGRVPSTSTLQKMSDAKKGKKRPPRSEEIKKKVSEAKKGKPWSSNHKKTRPLPSEEAKKKMSESHKGKHTSLEATLKMLTTKRERRG